MCICNVRPLRKEVPIWGENRVTTIRKMCARLFGKKRNKNKLMGTLKYANCFALDCGE